MVAWQAQIAGQKQWYLQSPLRDEHLSGFPDIAFSDKIEEASINKEHNDKQRENGVGKTLFYEFDIYPGEVLVWNVQMYHNTSSKERSLSLTAHVRCGDMREYAKQLGMLDIMRRTNFFWEAFYEHVKCRPNFVDLYKVCCEEWFGGKGIFRQFWGSFAL
jgi:hypothetical protein